MSSYWSGYHGTALVLTEKEYISFIDCYARANGTDYETVEEEISICGIREYDFIRSSSKSATETSKKDSFQIVDILTDDCEGMCLRPYFVNGKANTYEEIGRDMIIQEFNENVYVVFSDRSLDSPYVFEKPAYKSYDELIEEYKGKLEAYLPKEFQWDLHMGSFSYAAFC